MNELTSVNDIELKIIAFVPYCDVYKKFILKCLSVIHDQVYSNYDVVVVNDGSNDTEEISNYIKDKNNYHLLHCEANGGPAASKWAFLHYIQTNVARYTLNDIIIIIDGDDYLSSNGVFSLINNVYQQNKCWMTYGNAVGKFCENNNISIPDEWTNIRTERWIYNHPRTFKLALALTFKEDDFKMDGAWLTKGTDRPLVYNSIEMAGRSRCKFIDSILYNYIEHDQNSYKTVNRDFKLKQINYLSDLSPKDQIVEDVHIVMCCWKRLENLEAQVHNLNDQTIAKRIHFHLLNNNIDTVDTLNTMVADLSQKYTNIKLSVTHYQNNYFGFQRFLYIRDNLIKHYNIDYVIIIDDDQLFQNDWVEKMYAIRAPRTYTCWYGKVWDNDNIDYWRGSLFNMKQCRMHDKSEYTEFHYGATCGCMIDVSIFNETSNLWNVPTDITDNTNVYNIEDLWLSFVVRKIYGWSIKRSFLPEGSTLNVKGSSSEKNALYLLLTEHKQNLLRYLVDKYGL